MAINLEKGQRVDVGLTNVAVGLGWDPNPSSSSFDCDLDAMAFMLGSDQTLVGEEYFIFFNNMNSPDRTVVLSGDDRTGASSDGDDEVLLMDLDRVEPRIQEIIICVSIFEFDKRQQNLGQVRNAFVRIYDRNCEEEMVKYELDEDFSVETAVEFGRLYRRSNAWRFEAMGLGHRGGAPELLAKYS